ncbi:MAG TPA: xanthine dehydrogenase molybdopterin binding subunit, partial [Sphingopyxis sp.]
MADAGIGARGVVHRDQPHDSARGHVTGAARYIDDLPQVPGLLHLAFGLSRAAHARIADIDLAAARAVPSVVAVLTAADIPGENNVGPIFHDDQLLATEEVHYVGQPIFLVAAETREAARRAAKLGVIGYERLPVELTIA